MEFKNTFEILTKDIQDIEKLVASLQNSGGGSTIELDLALSKLRNVYEILTLIRDDRSAAASNPEPRREAPAPPSERREIAPQDRRGISPLAGDGEQPQAETGVPPQAQTGVPPQAETGVPPQAQTGVPPQEQTGTPAGNETGADSGPGSGTLPAEPPREREDPVATSPAPSILAEKFSASSSINDNMGGGREKKPESKYLGKPIDSIGRNIGINDRFLIIREMFDGDADRFSRLVRQLDEAGNYEEAEKLLDEAFSGNRDHDGAEILEGLVKRRYTLK